MTAETHSTDSTHSRQVSSGQTRNCQNCQQNFTIEPDDFSFYEKMQVPPPTFCPECRMIRRFVFRNERGLYRRKDDVSGKEIFSGIHPEAPVKVYEREYWWSDAWDPMQYGRDYDFSQSFFEQFRELMRAVPWPSRSGTNFVNSDYSNNAANIKNAYLCFDFNDGENIGYIVDGNNVKDSFDIYAARHTELSYDNYMSDESYKVLFSVNCEECHEVWFSRNLIGCQNCFGCVNLRNKSYHIWNKPVTREEYKKFMEAFQSGSRAAIDETKQKAYAFWSQFPMRFTLGINNVNSTGEHIEHCKNVKESYCVHDGENMKYCQKIAQIASDSYDHTVWGQRTSLIYESCVIGDECSEIKFSNYCTAGSRNIEYSMWCPSSSNLFGCVGLRKKQYCIFNKQYTKEEYEQLRTQIMEHMNTVPFTDKQGKIYRYGEFFPQEFSPNAYNETIAQDFFPLTKEQAGAKGYLWREPDMREYQTTIDAKNLPDDIKEVNDEILKEIIKCENCSKAYRIIPMELAFYRRIPLPLPRRCVECRFKDRFQFVNPPKFWPAACDCMGGKSKTQGKTGNIYANLAGHFHGEGPCPNKFETSYQPGHGEIVYCESCYQSEVA